MAYRFGKADFIEWWKGQQSFTQKKDMYEAAARIRMSIIDQDLFDNSLAWGVNIDGFVLNADASSVRCIFEKRISSYKPPKYTISTYDPNIFFHGTNKKAGDFPSWNILFGLARKLNAALILLTFDKSGDESVGVSEITAVSKESGLTYRNGTRPFQKLFNRNIPELIVWLRL